MLRIAMAERTTGGDRVDAVRNNPDLANDDDDDDEGSGSESD